ncbi:MAG: 2-C-methyl-D-erythritol 4-phosphate cytidylyltransferase, partial [Candidatus Adiutrix sp.]
MAYLSHKVSAIIVAGGLGHRFGTTRPKQLAPLNGAPVLTHTLTPFEQLSIVDEIILVVPAPWRKTIEADAITPFNFTKVKIINGGDSRTQSAKLGFMASCGEIVLVHDGVRPLVSPTLIERIIHAAATHGAAIPTIPSHDTLKKITNHQLITIDRSNICRTQTPQGFKREILAQAFSASSSTHTDEAALVESIGHPITMVEGFLKNMKITTQEDLELASALLSPPKEVPFRIGQGYDMHRLTPDRPLWLGLVHIPWPQGLLGHSDADVLVHALIDALLGAAALGDIGEHFSDKDPKWAGAKG